MTELGTFDFWGFAAPWIQGIVFFILGIVATMVVERRRNLRTDHEIWVWETSKSLRKESLGHSEGHLEYVVDGLKVTDPYELTLAVWAHGRKDIPFSLFNGEARIELGVPIVAILKHYEHGDEEADIEVDNTGIVVRPSVVRKDAALEWVMLTDGRPTIKVVGRPLDTEFYNWGDLYRGPRPAKIWTRIAGIFLLVAAFPFLIGFSIYLDNLGINPLGTPLQFLPIVFALMLTGGMALLLYSVTMYGSRLRLARKAFESRKLTEMGS